MLLRWNKAGREKFKELSKDVYTITTDETPLLYGKDRVMVFKMWIGSVDVYITPKFFNKLIEHGVLTDRKPVEVVEE